MNILLEVLMQNKMYQDKEFWTQKGKGTEISQRYNGFDSRPCNKVSVTIK